ncbi:MAG: TIGR03086 family metal-binding protein [Micromonosporaceae bacterium]
MITSTDTTADLLEVVLAELEAVVGGVADEQLRHSTPCSEFDVQQLRNHILGWLSTFAAGFAHPEGRAPRDGIDNCQPPVDPARGVRVAAEQLVRALRDGAANRPLWLGDNAMPGAVALSMILWEYQVHGWDLARATGQPWDPPAAAARESLAFAPAMLTADYQGEGKAFANPVEVPADAPAFDRLLGLSGRDPGWSRD